MNEEVLLKLYDKYNLSTVGDFEQFKSAMSTPEGQKAVYDKYLSKVGTFDQFQQAIGSTQPTQVAPEPTQSQNNQTKPSHFRTVPRDSKVGKFIESLPGLVSRGATEFVPSIMEVAGAGESLIGSGLRKLGVNEGEPLIPQAAQKTREFVEEGTYVDPEIEQSTAGQVASGVGQLIPFVATAGMSGGAQLGARTPQVMGIGKQAVETVKAIGKQAASPTGIIGGSMVAGPEWRAAKEAGLSDEEAFSTMVQNYFVGQTEIIPIHNALKVLDKVSGGKLVSTLKSVGTGGFQEAVQEAFQTYLTNEIAKGSYDPDRDPMFQVLESAKVGGLVGMLIPAVGSVVPRSKQVQEKLDKKVVELQINEEISKSDTGNPEINAGIDNQTKDVTDAIQEQGVQPKTTSTQEDPQVQEPTSEEEKVTKQVSEPVTDQTVADEQVTDQPAKSVSELVTEFNESGTLLGQAEDTAEGKRSALSENVADFLRSKGVTEQSQIDEFVTELNSKSVEGQPIIKPADVNRISSLLQTPKPKPFDGETVVRKVNDEIKRISAEFAKGKTKGVRAGRAFVKEQLVKLREALKEFPLTNRQTSAIAKRIMETNPFTPGSTSKLNEFIRKVTSDATYADKLNKATRLQRVLKKGKRKGTPEERQAFDLFLEVDPKQVDLDTYLDMVSKLAATTKGVKAGSKETKVEFKAAPLQEINKFSRGVLESAYQSITGNKDGATKTPEQLIKAYREAKEKQRQKEMFEALQDKFEGVLNLEELQELFADDSDVDAKIEGKEQAEKLLRETAQQYQAAMPEQHVENQAGMGKSGLFNEKAIWDGLRNLDLSKLKPAELKKFIITVDRVMTNGSYAKANVYELIPTVEANMKELASLKDAFVAVKRGDFGASLSSIANYFDTIFGKMAKIASKFQLYSGFTGITDASAKVVSLQKQLVDKLNNLKDSKKYNPVFRAEPLMRRSIFNILVTHPEGSDADTVLAENKELIERDIETYTKADAVEDKTLGLMLERLYKPFREVTTIEQARKVMKGSDPLSLEVHDMIVDFYKQFTESVRDYNYYVYGEVTPSIVNYAGERSYITIGQKVELETDVDEIDKQPSAFFANPLAGTPKRVGTAMARNAKVKRDAKGNILPNEVNGVYKVLNYNLDAIAERTVRKTMFNVYGINSILLARMVGNKRAELVDMFGGDKKAETIYNQIYEKGGIYQAFENASREIGTGPKTKAEIQANKWLSWAREVAYYATLSGPSQIAKQSVVLLNAAFRLGGKSVKYMSFKALGNKSVQELLKGTSVGTREYTQSIFNISGMLDPIQTTNKLHRGLASYKDTRTYRALARTKGWLGGLKLLTWTDARVAQVSYLAFYRKHLSDNKIKFKNWEQELAQKDTKARKEAHAYAKHMVDTLQTASNPNEQGRALQTVSPVGQFVKGTVLPYGTFSLNQKMRLIGSANTLLNLKGVRGKQRAIALNDLAATTAEIITFKAVSYATKAGLGYMFYSLVKSMLPGLDDEAIEEKMRTDKNFYKDLKKSLILEMTPLLITQPESVQEFIPWAVNESVYQFAKQTNPDVADMSKSQYEKEYGLPVTESFKGGNQLHSMFSDLGVFGAGAEAVVNIGESLMVATDKEQKDAKYHEVINDDQRKLAYLVALLEFGSLTGWVPSDVKFTAKRELAKQKRQRRENTYPIK